jgi:hypothetical protein
VELPRVDAGGRTRALPSPLVRRLLASLAVLTIALFALAAHAGTARADDGIGSTAAPAANPVLVTDMNKAPSGYRLTASRVLRIAAADPRVKAEVRKHPHARPYEYKKGPGIWQVSWFAAQQKPDELMQVYVDDSTGKVLQVWTGHQVAWTMARGYPGAFGRRSNALYVWLPLCLLFIAPFLPWPRRRARERGSPEGAEGSSSGRPGLSLLHLDLLMLLGFSISLAFFNHADIGLSVPLVYPFLLYLLVRMLLLAFGKGIPRRPLSTNVSANWLMLGVVFLLALRIGLDVFNSNVIDVGYAGVIGADKLIHGHMLYGHWPSNNSYGDTYGPFNYLAYVPFRLIFGWSGSWDSLPAAHAAAIAFDLLTVAGLYILGLRIRGHSLGVILMYAWVAYPFTLFTLSTNSNDELVSALLVFALVAISSPSARGVFGALAGLTKFAPFALAPLLWRGTGPRLPGRRPTIAYAVGFVAATVAAMLPVLLDGNLHFFWHDSIAYQSSRVTPFSIWGLWGGLGAVQHLLEGAAVGLAIMVAFVPRRRGIVEVAALGAAVVIALQLIANYWLYPYIVWFFPLVAVALFAGHPERRRRLVAPSPQSYFELPEREPVSVA